MRVCVREGVCASVRKCVCECVLEGACVRV